MYSNLDIILILIEIFKCWLVTFNSEAYPKIRDGGYNFPAQAIINLLHIFQKLTSKAIYHSCFEMNLKNISLWFSYTAPLFF